MKLHLACAKLIRSALLAAAVLAPGTALADTMVIDNVTLIDGTGQPAQAGMSVAIDDGRTGRVWTAMLVSAAECAVIAGPDGPDRFGDAAIAAEDASCVPGSSPVDLMVSSKHCGRCGHDCFGDACLGGRCVVTDETGALMGNATDHDIIDAIRRAKEARMSA